MSPNSSQIFLWNESLETGVAEIDKQHKQLFILLYNLNLAMKEGHAHNELGALIHALGAYALEHFETEEAYMEKIKYHELEDHKARHKWFMVKLVEFDTQFKEGNVLLTPEVMLFMRDWLVTHIGDCDQKLAKNPLPDSSH